MSTSSEKLTHLSIESIFSHFDREKRVELKKKVPVLRSIHVPIHIPRFMFGTSSFYNDRKWKLYMQSYDIYPTILIEISENREKTKVTIGRCEKYSSFDWKTLFRNFLNFLVFRTGNTVAHLEIEGRQDITNFFEKPPNGVNSLAMHLRSEWPLDFLLKFQNLRRLKCTFNVKVPNGYFKHENFQHLESLHCDCESKGMENALELLDLNVKQLRVYDKPSSYDRFLTFVKKLLLGRYSLNSGYTTNSVNLTKDELFEKLLLDVPARETSHIPWNPPKVFRPDTLTIDISDEIELNIYFFDHPTVVCFVNKAGAAYPRIIRREVVENKRMRLE